MKYLKYHLYLWLFFCLNISSLLGQNQTDTSNITFYSKIEIINRKCYFENAYFSFRLNTNDYNIDSTSIIITFKNKLKKECYLNKDIFEEYQDGDSLTSFSNYPVLPYLHSDRESYVLDLLKLNEEFNSNIKIKKNSIKKINLRLIFSYTIDEIEYKYFKKDHDNKKQKILQGYIGSYDEGKGIQEIIIYDFYLNERGETSILFIGIQ